MNSNRSQFVLALGIKEFVGTVVIGLGHENFGEAIQVPVVREVRLRECLGRGDSMFFQHGHEHLGVDERTGIKEFGHKDQLGAMSASSGVGGFAARSFISARMAIIPALSVQTARSARRRAKRSRSQAAASCARKARLLVTPPDAVTQRTPRRRAARMVFWTNTSTMAACTLAQRSHTADEDAARSGCFWRKYRTEVFRPAKLKSSPGSPSSGRGKP